MEKREAAAVEAAAASLCFLDLARVALQLSKQPLIEFTPNSHNYSAKRIAAVTGTFQSKVAK